LEFVPDPDFWRKLIKTWIKMIKNLEERGKKMFNKLKLIGLTKNLNKKNKMIPNTNFIDFKNNRIT